MKNFQKIMLLELYYIDTLRWIKRLCFPKKLKKKLFLLKYLKNKENEKDNIPQYFHRQ